MNKLTTSEIRLMTRITKSLLKGGLITANCKKEKIGYGKYKRLKSHPDWMEIEQQIVQDFALNTLIKDKGNDINE